MSLPASALALALTVAMLVVPAAQAAQAGNVKKKASLSGEMTLTPSAVAAGAPLSLTGAGLPRHRLVAISLDGGHPAYAGTDGRGRWAKTVLVPRRARGHVMLRVRVGLQRLFEVRVPIVRSTSAEASLALLTTGEHASLSSTGVAAGAIVQLTGRGFRGHDLAGVWLAGKRLARPRPGAGGSLRASVRIPATTAPRGYVLSLHYRGQLDFYLRVTPRAGHSAGGAPAPPGSSPPSPPTSPPTTTGGSSSSPPPSDVVVDAVADMACDPSDANYNGGNGNPAATYPNNNCLGKYVSQLITGDMPNALLEIGDVQQDPSQSLQSYQQAFDPTFGRANSVAFPEVGNAEYGHEFNNGSSEPPSAFFDYFQNAGVFSHITEMQGSDTSHLTQDEMYYSFNLGSWHFIALNSNCSESAAPPNLCGAEDTWLQQDLANYRQSNPTGCILAYWHHPLFSTTANSNVAQAWWQDLYNAHATLVLNGHGGNSYQRYAPQDPSGNATSNGIREFIVSMGGLSHTSPGTARNLQASNYDTFGILQLTLHAGSYDWNFIPATGDGQGTTYSDSGSAACAQ